MHQWLLSLFRGTRVQNVLTWLVINQNRVDTLKFIFISCVFRLRLSFFMPVTETYCLLISSDVADRWEMMNAVADLTSVLSLVSHLLARVCLTCKQNIAAEDMFKHLQITANQPRHEVSSLVNL